jgi:hypothetical protein
MSSRRKILVGGLVGLVVTAPLLALFYFGGQLASLPMVAFDLFEREIRIPQLGGVVTKSIDIMVSIFSKLPGVSTDVASKSFEQFSALAEFLVIGAIFGIGYVLLRDRLGRYKTAALGGVAWALTVLFELSYSVLSMDFVINAIWLAVLYFGWSYIVAQTVDILLMPPQPGIDLSGRRQFLIQLGGTAIAVTIGAWGIGNLFGRSASSGPTGQTVAGAPTPGGSSAPAPQATHRTRHESRHHRQRGFLSGRC